MRKPAPCTATRSSALIPCRKALGLPEVEDFPFIDPPTPRAVADGYQLLTELPMAGAVLTRAQIESLAARDDVESIYLNERLSYGNFEAGEITGGHFVHDQYGAKGAGVTVAVIDSGIDANHPDLRFGSKTIQNVKLVGDLGLAGVAGLQHGHADVLRQALGRLPAQQRTGEQLGAHLADVLVPGEPQRRGEHRQHAHQHTPQQRRGQAQPPEHQPAQQTLQDGQQVTFDTEPDRMGKGPKAVNIQAA